MKSYLEPLKASVLTHMEFGQLMKRLLNDLSTIDQTLLTDQPYTDYFRELTDKLTIYEKGLAQVRKNEETEKIAIADTVRDKAISSFAKALKLYAISDKPEEIEASRILRILFSTYKNLARLSYEAESIGLDKLVNDLQSAHYAEQIAILNLERNVDRMKVTNEDFKTIFSSRMEINATTDSYDVKTIRAEMLQIYNDYIAYILAMSKAHITTPFNLKLSLLNTARKYYSDLLAHRNSVKAVASNP